MIESEGECNDRLARRHDVLLHARCRQSAWKLFDVELGNISAGGCSIIGSRETFQVGQALNLRIANLKALDGHVTWIARDAVGVEFTAALSEPVIARLNADYGLGIAS